MLPMSPNSQWKSTDAWPIIKRRILHFTRRSHCPWCWLGEWRFALKFQTGFEESRKISRDYQVQRGTCLQRYLENFLWNWPFLSSTERFPRLFWKCRCVEETRQRYSGWKMHLACGTYDGNRKWTTTRNHEKILWQKWCVIVSGNYIR